MKKVKPKAGQESVWDYPRPPIIEKVTQRIKVIANNILIYDNDFAYRVLETSHPPTYYLPIGQFKNCTLQESHRTSYCEFKGVATYYDLLIEGKIINSPAWGYSDPRSKYSDLKRHISIYAHLVDECLVDNEKVQPQEGDFYGGWITSKVVGPFKGGSGTWGW